MSRLLRPLGALIAAYVISLAAGPVAASEIPRGTDRADAIPLADRQVWEDEIAQAQKDLTGVEAALRKIPKRYRSRRYRVRPYPYRSQVRALKYRRSELKKKIAKLLELRAEP